MYKIKHTNIFYESVRRIDHLIKHVNYTVSNYFKMTCIFWCSLISHLSDSINRSTLWTVTACFPVYCTKRKRFVKIVPVRLDTHRLMFLLNLLNISICSKTIHAGCTRYCIKACTKTVNITKDLSIIYSEYLINYNLNRILKVTYQSHINILIILRVSLKLYALIYLKFFCC